MYKSKKEIFPYVIPVIITVIISGCFKLDFIQTLICSLLVLLIAGIVKILNKKKLCAMISVENPVQDKCKASVLLWNPSAFRIVYNSDYSDGLCIITDYDTSCKLEKPTIRKGFSVQPKIADNEIKLRMGDLMPKAFIEFDLIISKIDTSLEPIDKNSLIITSHLEQYLKSEGINDLRITRSGIVLPPNVKTNTTFEEAPSIGLVWNHANLKINIIKYNKIYQAIHWVCSISAIIISVFIPIYIVIAALGSTAYNVIYQNIFLFLSLIVSLLTIIICIGDIVPPFIKKHLAVKEKQTNRK